MGNRFDCFICRCVLERTDQRYVVTVVRFSDNGKSDIDKTADSNCDIGKTHATKY